MDSSQRPGLLGMRHIALFVGREQFDATVRFYREGMGMQTDWEPDADNVYLTSGGDNIAIHRVTRDIDTRHGALDHLGFLVPRQDDVQAWHARLSQTQEELGIEILTPVETHRDGATSFYLLDPAGAKVQIINLPAISS